MNLSQMLECQSQEGNKFGQRKISEVPQITPLGRQGLACGGVQYVSPCSQLPLPLVGRHSAEEMPKVVTAEPLGSSFYIRLSVLSYTKWKCDCRSVQEYWADEMIYKLWNIRILLTSLSRHGFSFYCCSHQNSVLLYLLSTVLALNNCEKLYRFWVIDKS